MSMGMVHLLLFRRQRFQYVLLEIFFISVDYWFFVLSYPSCNVVERTVIFADSFQMQLLLPSSQDAAFVVSGILVTEDVDE